MRAILPAFSTFAARCARAFLVPVTLAVSLAGLPAATASAASCVSWSGTPAQNSVAGYNVLTAASVLLPCDAWAVGWFSGNGANQTLIENWNGTSWNTVTSPSPGTTDNILNGVAAISRSDAWAVGSYSDGGVVQGLILHYDGSGWTKVPSPNPSGDTTLAAIGAVSASDIWAVGDFGIVAAAAPARAAVSARSGAPARADASGRDASARTASTTSHTLVLHWDGTSWKQVASPTPGTGGGLTGVTATSASNAWAVGDFTAAGGANLSMILHWNGTAWARQASPAPGTASGLTAADATSASDAWAVGFFNNGTVARTLTLHWNGTQWAQVPSPDGAPTDNLLNGVAAASATSARAVGGYATPGGVNTLILRWDGTRWAQVQSPAPGGPPGGASAQLLGAAAGPAGTIWTVGYFADPTPPNVDTLALHCC
jgi:hypothetical protein